MNELRKKIIVADDDQDILDILKMILEVVGGYEVITTTDGESVYDLLDETPPDLILLDLWMSGQDGSEICKNLKADKSTRNLPLILFSASKNIREISRTAGADDYIAKPFQMDVLLEKVERLTGSG